MYLFRRISEEKNLTKGSRGRVDIYQSLNPNLNYLIGCAKSNVKALDDKLPNWHVIEKEIALCKLLFTKRKEVS